MWEKNGKVICITSFFAEMQVILTLTHNNLQIISREYY